MLNRYLARLSLLVLLLPAGCVAYEPGPVSITLEEGQSGRIYFQSVDAYDFPEMIVGRTPGRVIHGDLSLPAADAPLRGAVILSHGSGGVGSRQERMAELLVAEGFMAFTLDHFSPRDVGSTARDQIRITEQGMLADVAAAQKLLATHPRLEASEIGHMGWSKGAVVALAGSVARFAGYAEMLEPLAFSIAFYPFCGFDVSEEKLASPLLILIGSEDNWTPAPPCSAAVNALEARGEPAEIELYQGAQHGFDSRSPDFEIGSAITVRRTDPACALIVDQNGLTRSRDGAQQLGTLDGRIAYLRACGVRGVGFGGNATARAASRDRVLSFIARYLP